LIPRRNGDFQNAIKIELNAWAVRLTFHASFISQRFSRSCC
jgi:hypothetical protein